MAEIALIKKFLGIVLATLLCLLHATPTSAGPVDIDDMDYDQLLSLLAEEGGQRQDSLEAQGAPFESNDIPEYYAPPPPPPKASASKGAASSSFDFTITKPSASATLAPHVEILQIVESFLRLKGEMGARVHALINDNFDLFQSVYNVIVAKTAKLHGFTLMGISVIRRILEFAVRMIGTWELNAPSVSIGVNKVFAAMG